MFLQVKCDKQTPSCERCQSLGGQCPGYAKYGGSNPPASSADTVESIFRTAGLERRKIGACRECRATKSKCNQARPQCRRCYAKSLPCTYTSRLHKPRNLEPVSNTNMSVVDDTPSALHLSPQISPHSIEDEVAWSGLSIIQLYNAEANFFTF